MSLSVNKERFPVLVVHGGAWDIPPDLHAAHRAGTQQAVAVGWEVLDGGGSALDAVEAAIRAMEDDPTFDAGIGSVLTADGTVEMDAGIMEGETLKIGAVAAIQHYAAPISIARRILEYSHHHLLVGAGAEAFAAAQGFDAVPNERFIVAREQDYYDAYRAGTRTTADSFGGSDTVGALARDKQGRLAAGNSTGGVSFSHSGRVGDAPLPGVGYYADNRFGAVVCTGWGEHIMRVGLALRAMHLLESGLPAQQVAEQAVALIRERVAGKAGLLVVDREGRVGIAHSTPYMAFAYRVKTEELVFGLQAGQREQQRIG
jgi:beta-aspartyl-peptidase (threonine type)